MPVTGWRLRSLRGASPPWEKANASVLDYNLRCPHPSPEEGDDGSEDDELIGEEEHRTVAVTSGTQRSPQAPLSCLVSGQGGLLWLWRWRRQGPHRITGFQNV